MVKKRLDEFLVARGDAAEKHAAFLMITEGRVFVNGQKAVAAVQRVGPDAKIEVREGQKYVGRGALKLEAAIQKFGLDVTGKICADIGAATGGFTEVLLNYGAKKVYAIDTARGKLALKIREDPRVVVMESTDVRDIGNLPEPVDCIVIDVSLISLRGILPSARRFLAKDGIVVTLFKPQYETRDPKLLRHGVIKDDAARKKLVDDFIAWAGPVRDAKRNSIYSGATITEGDEYAFSKLNKISNGAGEKRWDVVDWMESPIRGSKGNIEYLLLLKQK